MLLRRTAALLGGISGLLHLAMLAHGPLLLGLTMALAAVVCLPCAGHLWRQGTIRTWAIVGTMNVLMVVLHAGIMAGGGMTGGGGVVVETGHHHGALPVAVPLHGLFHLATVIAAAEVILCTAGLLLLIRGRVARQPLPRNARESESCRNEWTGKPAGKKLSAPI